ncbi:MAG TPA: hypothetical protein VKB87_01780 [Myxococcaceae bacterium]|nr:hypothetical protein [Myxococcaceae bacterium]
MAHDPWYYYSRALDNYKVGLDQLDYAAVAPKLPKDRFRTQGFFTVSELTGRLTLDDIKSLLSESVLGPPHGFDLLRPLPLPSFPRFPERPQTSPPIQKPQGGFSIFGSPWRAPKHEVDLEITVMEETLHDRTAALRQAFEHKYESAKSQLDELRARCAANDYEAVRLLINLSHARHDLPSVFRRFWEVDFDQTSRILLCTFELPDFGSLNISKRRNSKLAPLSAAERKRSNETIIYSLCLRAAYIGAKSDAGDWFDTVAVNLGERTPIFCIGEQRLERLSYLLGSARDAPSTGQ